MIKRFFKITSLLLVIFFTITIGFVITYKYLPVHYTPLMMIRFAKTDKKITLNKSWVPLKEINKNILQKIIKAEDTKFYDHNGFDFEAIEMAMAYNKKVKNKPKRGASTISQQTAKNVFLWPSRSWIRKGLEVYFTVLIEALWSKDRILEVYLNIIELGDGVFGVEAAAKKFFKKSALKVNAHEASLMAAVLPNPLKLRIDHPSAYVLKRQRILLGQRALPKIVPIPVESEIIFAAESQDELEELESLFEDDPAI